MVYKLCITRYGILRCKIIYIKNIFVMNSDKLY